MQEAAQKYLLLLNYGLSNPGHIFGDTSKVKVTKIGMGKIKTGQFWQQILLGHTQTFTRHRYLKGNFSLNLVVQSVEAR